MTFSRVSIGALLVAISVFGVVVWLRNEQKRAQYSIPTDVEYSEAYVYDARSVDNLLRQKDVAHIVPLDEILSGGVPKDAIASMEDVEVVLPNDVPTWFDQEGMGIVMKVDGYARFYPYQILAHHEIANDVMHGRAIVVTYCPLCFTGVIYDARIDDNIVTFGVSGKLWQSNLIMYNRSNPESLWSQATGEAIVGAHVGKTLTPLPFDLVPFEAFRKSYPEGEVVIGDPTNRLAYARIPYGGDLSKPNLRFSTRGDDDTRLVADDIILGVTVDGVDKAYLLSAIVESKPFEDTVGTHTLAISYDRDKEIMMVYDITDGTRVQPLPHFWFSWAAMHPETGLYK